MNTTNDLASPLTDAVVQLSGKDGNVFAIIGCVRRAILSSNRPELAAQFCEEAMSGNYDNVLVTCMRYVDVQ